MKKLCPLLLLAATAFAQSIDRPAMEAYLRRLELMIPSVNIQMENPKRLGFFKDYSAFTVRFTASGQGNDGRYIVSSDGETLLRGEAYDLGKTLSKSKTSLDKPALEAFLRKLEALIPDVAVKIDDPKPAAFFKGSEVAVQFSYKGQVKNEHYLIAADNAVLIRGQAFPLKRSPFQANLDRINTQGQPAFGGPPNAPITLVMYVDLQCPYCRAEMDTVRKNMAQTYGDKVRVVFRDFPIAETHPWAVAAAIAGRCVYRQDQNRFWNYSDWILNSQPDVTVENFPAKLNQWVAGNGINASQFSACRGDKAVAAEVDKSLKDGFSLGANVTPTAFLNGSMLEGTVEWDVLRQLINVELNRLGVPVP